MDYLIWCALHAVEQTKGGDDYEREVRKIPKVLGRSLDAWAKKLKAGNVDANMKYQRFMALFNENKDFTAASAKFVSSLSAKGYNAMIDDNNSGVYNGANAPLYIFQGTSLKETGSSRWVSGSEFSSNTSQIKQQKGRLVL